MALAGCASNDGRDVIDAPGCELTVSFEPGLDAAGARALERVNAATGCAVHQAPGGVPVKAVPASYAPDGDEACGQTYIAAYSDGALHGIVGIQLSTDVGGCPPTDTVLVHELFHAMTGTRNEGHSADGVFAARAAVNAVIDSTSLDAVCSRVFCPAEAVESER